jgi:hypothetical protein
MIRLRADRIIAVVWPCAIAAVLAWGMSVPDASAKDPDSFIVHEWGTFSTFSGSNGKPLKFYPNDTDLPDFVHSRHRNVKGGLTDATVSLETPVLYFYTDRDRKVSVHVDFPKGLMTDWYPEASRPPDSTIRWDNLRVLAKDRLPLTVERGNDRYYAARETDAASVQTTEQDKKRENEKFLFYRGVGDFTMPFEVRALGHGTFAVKNTGKHAIPGHFLVSVQERKVTFKSLGRMSPGTEEKVELPAETSTAEKLGDAMASLLVEQGLFEKEARAMVKTWSKDWFADNGTRVLYLVAEPVTEELLPLKIDPKPDTLVRVLVGRHDVLTPEREVEIDAVVKRLHGDSNAEAKAADATMDKLGRYRSAAQAAAETRLKAREGVRAGR